MYTMGSAEPRSFSRGKRGIAGTLVFTIFDRDALLEALKGQATFYRIGGRSDKLYDTLETEIGQVARPLSIEDWDARMTEIALGDTNANNNVAIASSNSVQVTRNISSEADPYYADEIPPLIMAA